MRVAHRDKISDADDLLLLFLGSSHTAVLDHCSECSLEIDSLEFNSVKTLII